MLYTTTISAETLVGMIFSLQVATSNASTQPIARWGELAEASVGNVLTVVRPHVLRVAAPRAGAPSPHERVPSARVHVRPADAS